MSQECFGPVSHCALPDERKSLTHKFQVGAFEGYLIVGVYPDGKIGEMFIKTSKEGSTLKGMLNAFAISVSLGLQHGIPLDKFIEKFKYMRFEPEGTIGQDASSIIDYIFKWLEKKFENVSENKKGFASSGSSSDSKQKLSNRSSSHRGGLTSGGDESGLRVHYSANTESR